MSFFSETKIARAACRERGELWYALQEARNRKALSLGDKSLLEPMHASSLRAVNCRGRMLWGRAVSTEISRFFCAPGSVEHNQPVFFVTLADVTCARSITAPDQDMEAIKRRLRYGLRGQSYFGVIEPAFYTNLQAGVRFTEKRCVFWHLHALVWNISERKLKAILRRLEESGRYLAIAHGLKGTRAKKIKPGTLPKVLGYMLKPPSVAYRVSRRGDLARPDGSPVTNEDGEVLARFRQGKSELRPGDRVLLFKAMRPLYLDQLAIAGGKGTTLLARAKYAALKRWREKSLTKSPRSRTLSSRAKRRR